MTHINVIAYTHLCVASNERSVPVLSSRLKQANQHCYRLHDYTNNAIPHTKHWLISLIVTFDLCSEHVQVAKIRKCMLSKCSRCENAEFGYCQ